MLKFVKKTKNKFSTKIFFGEKYQKINQRINKQLYNNKVLTIDMENQDNQPQDQNPVYKKNLKLNRIWNNNHKTKMKISKETKIQKVNIFSRVFSNDEEDKFYRFGRGFVRLAHSVAPLCLLFD